MQRIISVIDTSPFLSQFIPLSLTLVVFAGLVGLLHASILLFNHLPVRELVLLEIRWYDVIIGATIYLKTAIDFAIFMGRLMAANPGWKNRIAIEIGTAGGNAVGTIIVVGLWVLFKDIHLLLALMVLIASLVLFELAHESLPHFETWKYQKDIRKTIFMSLRRLLDGITKLTDPVLSRIMPDIGSAMRGSKNLPWWGLLGFSMSVPFILGLDDFAGYVPLFNVVNVYGFAIGVIGAHTVLNICLFLSPRRTIEAVKNEWISFLGTLAFIGLALYGLWEVVRIVLETPGH
jgi:hypothetical protein